MAWNPEDAVILARVVDCGSFTRAAQFLELPKSTVSRRVSRLEAHLGVQLLVRTTRRLDLTDAGHAFYLRASRAVEALEDAGRVASSMLDVPRGRLRVTAPAELSSRMFKASLGFSRAYPEVHMDLDLSNRYVNLVEEGYDVAIRGGARPEGALSGRLVADAEVGVYASPDYLNARGRPRRIQDLATHDCVLFSSWSTQSQWTLEGPQGERTAQVKGRLTLNNLEAVRLAALEGLGLALLFKDSCEDDLQEGRIERVLPKYGRSNGRLWVTYPRTRFLSPKVRAFVEFLESAHADAST